MDAAVNEEENSDALNLVDFKRTTTYRHAEQYAMLLNEGAMVSTGSHVVRIASGLHWEMWLLEMAGAKPINVIKAATLNGAIKLGMQDRIGSIKVGKDADFVVLNSNPLDRIQNTIDISSVVRRGRVAQWLDRETQPANFSISESWQACRSWNLGAP
jgi:imidazolonepropionase-like amidohydrolase